LTDLSIAAALCREFEGFRARPYLCPAGIPTIGYGSTYYEDGRRVSLQDPPITRQAADDLLMYELRHTYLPGTLRACPNLALHPRRCNAIVDFAYNLGVGRLQTSTLRRTILAEDWDASREQLMRWVRGGGKVLPGLVRRRKAEAELL
jgi:lysozyme